MSRKTVVKPDALPDLDDLLQCPVCYEIPSGQIFQCNEGHHVCDKCKIRLDVCPVCRALFFGTRNYAMEELIANVRKLRAFKLGGKITTGSGSSENSTPVREVVSDETEITTADEDDLQLSNRSTLRPPPACKGVFRCLSCKNGNAERLPQARLLNHLRYFHSPELIEGQSENGEYAQAWQFTTDPSRITTAIRVSDMGIFFLIIEITYNSLCASLRIAASPWVAREFSYSITISGNDREAIFSDCVWSVRSCDGTLKKRGHCLFVVGSDAQALIAPATIGCKVSIRRSPPEAAILHVQPRVILRVASRGGARDNRDTRALAGPNELEPFLQDLQNDVARLTRAFATLGREANALVRSEVEIRATMEDNTQNRQNPAAPVTGRRSTDAEVDPDTTPGNQRDNEQRTQPSCRSLRRLRRRMRALLTPLRTHEPPQVATRQANTREAATRNSAAPNNQVVLMNGLAVAQQNPVSSLTANRQNTVSSSTANRQNTVSSSTANRQNPVSSSTANQQMTSGPSNGLPENRQNVRANKKNRRHRR